MFSRSRSAVARIATASSDRNPGRRPTGSGGRRGGRFGVGRGRLIGRLDRRRAIDMARLRGDGIVYLVHSSCLVGQTNVPSRQRFWQHPVRVARVVRGAAGNRRPRDFGVTSWRRGPERTGRPARRPVDPRRHRRAAARPTTTVGPTRPTRPSGSRSARRATAARRSGARSTRPTSWPRPRRSAATASGAGTPGRCSSAATRTPCRSRRRGPRSRCWSRTGSTCGSTPPTGTRRRRRCRTRSSSPTGRRTAGGTSPTGSSSRRRTTRPTTAASSTTRPTAARPTPTSRAGSRTRRTGSSRRRVATGSTASRGCPYERGRATAVTAYDFLGTYVDDLAASSTWTPIRGVRAAHRRRPDGRRVGRLLGRDRRALRAGPDRHQRARSTRRSGS